MRNQFHIDQTSEEQKLDETYALEEIDFTESPKRPWLFIFLCVFVIGLGGWMCFYLFGNAKTEEQIATEANVEEESLSVSSSDPVLQSEDHYVPVPNPETAPTIVDAPAKPTAKSTPHETKEETNDIAEKKGSEENKSIDPQQTNQKQGKQENFLEEPKATEKKPEEKTINRKQEAETIVQSEKEQISEDPSPTLHTDRSSFHTEIEPSQPLSLETRWILSEDGELSFEQTSGKTPILIENRMPTNKWADPEHSEQIIEQILKKIPDPSNSAIYFLLDAEISEEVIFDLINQLQDKQITIGLAVPQANNPLNDQSKVLLIPIDFINIPEKIDLSKTPIQIYHLQAHIQFDNVQVHSPFSSSSNETNEE